jgi:hypothetical protein
MTESEWRSSRDVEAMLTCLWDQSPDLQWTHRKPRLLFVACCRPAMPLLPLEVLTLAGTIYDDQSFDRLPELADALAAAAYTNPHLVDHCRTPGPHVRGCWALDLLRPTLD